MLKNFQIIKISQYSRSSSLEDKVFLDLDDSLLGKLRPRNVVPDGGPEKKFVESGERERERERERQHPSQDPEARTQKPGPSSQDPEARTQKPGPSSQDQRPAARTQSQQPGPSSQDPEARTWSHPKPGHH